MKVAIDRLVLSDKQATSLPQQKRVATRGIRSYCLARAHAAVHPMNRRFDFLKNARSGEFIRQPSDYGAHS